MLALRSTVVKTEAMAYAWMHAHNALLAKWNALIARINAKGGEQFMQHGILPSQQAGTFTPEEIRVLVRLCHPDLHNNSEAAQRMTQKLLKLRK